MDEGGGETEMVQTSQRTGKITDENENKSAHAHALGNVDDALAISHRREV